MEDAIKQGATVDEAIRHTEKELFVRYKVPKQTCQVGGDQVPGPLKILFSLIPRSVVGAVHGLFKRATQASSDTLIPSGKE
jgi:hypothetical protein